MRKCNNSLKSFLLSFYTINRPNQTGKQPTYWNAVLNNRYNERQFEIVIVLQTLPVIEVTLNEHIKRMLLAVVTD